MRCSFLRFIFGWMAFASPAIAEKSPKEEAIEHGLFYGNYVNSSHPGAYHALNMLGLPGGSVCIEDGSKWAVAPYYWDQINDWLPGDTLLIVPNRPWFSDYYEFRIANERTQQEVLANWFKPPSRDNPSTRYILRLHAYEIILDDNSRWRVKGTDREITKKWRINDIVIIGTNNGWLSWSNPNILINMRDSSHVRGACMAHYLE